MSKALVTWATAASRRSWPLAVALLSACAPTFAGQLRDAQGGELGLSDGRINVTALTPQAVEGQERQGTLILPVDGHGRFATKAKLPPGEYLVEALVPGYKPQSQRINLAQNHQVDLTLTPLPAVKAHATSAGGAVDESRGSGAATLMPPSL